LAYSFPPLRLSYRGGGELLQGLGCGVVLPLVGYYLQAGTLGSFPLAVLFPSFLLAAAGNVTTALPDHPADRAADKRTYPVRLGQLTARRHVLQSIALAAFIAVLVVPGGSILSRGLVFAITIAILSANLRLLGSADATNEDECLRFVVMTSSASAWAWLGFAFCAFFLRAAIQSP
jgi:1,4-dihydroxy-2-naphthoate octaprenyltransferase